MFTLSYGGAVGVAVACGALWDVTGAATMAFVPMGLCAVVLAATAWTMRARGRLV
jgi:hypothetical protein